MYDIIIPVMDKLLPADRDTDFTDSEYRYVERYVLMKYLEKSTISEIMIPITQETFCRLEVDQLPNGLFVEIKQSLLIKSVGPNKYCCIGTYDRKTGNMLPLTEENKEYAKKLNLEMV